MKISWAEMPGEKLRKPPGDLSGKKDLQRFSLPKLHEKLPAEPAGWGVHRQMGNPSLSLMPGVHHRRLLRMNGRAEGLSGEFHIGSHVEGTALSSNHCPHAELGDGRPGERGCPGE